MSNYGTFGENNPVWRAICRITDMVVMGILFLLTCIPIITIGAALSGFYYAAMDSMRKEDGYVLKRYFTAFGRNFKKATLIWLFFIITGGICFMDVYFWAGHAEITGALFMFAFSLILCIVWLMTFIFAFPLQARFENTVKKTIENAFLLAVSHLPFTIIMFLLIGILAVLCYITWPAAIIFIIIGIGIVGYLVVHYYETNFKKWGYIDKDDGKIKDDDMDFKVEIDYDELYGHDETETEEPDDIDGTGKEDGAGDDVETDQREEDIVKEDAKDE